MTSPLFRSRIRAGFVRIGALAGLSALGVVAFVACGDDDQRQSFDDLDSGGTPPANLPEAGGPFDAGEAPDAKTPFSDKDEEITCATDAGPCVKDLVAGKDHFCALLTDGTVRCWGKDDFGSLGRGLPTDGGVGDAGDGGDAGDAGVPSYIKPVRGLSDVTQISAGLDTTCALVGDGGVRCWGGNAHGELGLSVDPPEVDNDPHPVIKQVDGLGAAKRVDVGQGTVCATLTTGKVVCWGKNDFAQLARPDAGSDPVPLGPGNAELGTLPSASFQIGSFTSIAVTHNGEVWSWGALSGEEGYVSGVVSSISPDITPRRIAELSGVKSLSVSLHFQPERPFPPGGIPMPQPPLPPRAHACAIVAGAVYCWGRSDSGALGTGLPDRAVKPAYAVVDSKAWPQRVAVGNEVSCIRLTDGTVQCCGGNTKGRLGDSPATLPFSMYFTPVKSFTGHAARLAAGDTAVCALLKDGNVQCWGGNTFGEIGTFQGDETVHAQPTPVGF